MIIFPRAKINIGLRITRKRPDGFHDIETIFYPTNLGEALEFTEANEDQHYDSLTVTGIETGCRPDDNLVMIAVKKLRERFSFPFLRIHLHKTIPSGAGLGGGSADAAYLLKGVDRHFNLQAGKDVLKEMALQLGSDCPFFIEAVPAYATGRGEVLQTVSPRLAGMYLVLLNPGVGINTAEAYRNCNPAEPAESLLIQYNRPVAEWKNFIYNDFEEFAFKKHPVIGEIKRRLYDNGALFSTMSGSGSSVFGLFSGKPSLPKGMKDFVICQGPL